MKSFCQIVCIGIAFALAGCASVGTPVDVNALSSFEKGKTTYAEVVAKLGPPTQNTVSNTGQRTVMYIYAESQVRPETFIPIVGSFVGGADTRSTAVSLAFDQNGVLESYSSTNSQFGTATGLASGVQPADRTDQPRTSGGN